MRGVGDVYCLNCLERCFGFGTVEGFFFFIADRELLMAGECSTFIPARSSSSMVLTTARTLASRLRALLMVGSADLVVRLSFCLALVSLSSGNATILDRPVSACGQLNRRGDKIR